MGDTFEKLLHPALREKLSYLLEDLRARGWNPVVPEVFGVKGTGYRSVADQQKLIAKHPNRTKVKFSFHNVTTRGGTPQSMAVHVTEKSLGQKYSRDHPFLKDLEVLSERHGLRTGNSWKTPWDPLHVQLAENSSLKNVKAGRMPPPLESRLRLLPPRLGAGAATYLPPRTADNFMHGERFRLQRNISGNPFAGQHTYWHDTMFKPPPPPPPPTRHEFDLGQRFQLSPPTMRNSVPANLGTLAPIARPIPPQSLRLGDFNLRRPDVGGNVSTRFNFSEPLRLTQPFSGNPFASKPLNLGSFTLKPPSL